MILEAIFNGQIYPAETVVPKCRKFRDAGEAIANIMGYTKGASSSGRSLV